jgi:hypothetical protein
MTFHRIIINIVCWEDCFFINFGFFYIYIYIYKTLKTILLNKMWRVEKASPRIYKFPCNYSGKRANGIYYYYYQYSIVIN